MGQGTTWKKKKHKIQCLSIQYSSFFSAAKLLFIVVCVQLIFWELFLKSNKLQWHSAILQTPFGLQDPRLTEQITTADGNWPLKHHLKLFSDAPVSAMVWLLNGNRPKLFKN